MDNTLICWLSIIIIISLGILAHFLYDIAKQPRFLGLFTAVNESTWEHIKIAIPHWVTYLSAIGTFIFFGCYMTLTLAPVKSPIFKDPITGKYGFLAHHDYFKSLKKKSHKNSKYFFCFVI